MAGTSQARDGRQSLAWILEPTGEELTTGALAIGDIVVVLGKASTGSIFGAVPVNSFFIAVKALTLASGDKCKKMTAYFLGNATGKTVNASKNIVDVTMDYDEATNNTTDGQVTKTGSISGMNVTESSTMKSGVNFLKRRFDSLSEFKDDGSVVYEEAKTTDKDIVMIAWNGRNIAVGDVLELEIMPVLLSSQAKGGEYGSSQTLNYDFTAAYTDENGYVGGLLQAKYVDGLLPGTARPVATA